MFDVIMIIMFWGVVFNYVSLSSVWKRKKKVSEKGIEGGVKKRRKKNGKEKEKGWEIFLQLHVGLSKKGRGFYFGLVFFFNTHTTQHTHTHDRERQRGKKEKKKRRRRKEEEGEEEEEGEGDYRFGFDFNSGE